MATEEAVEITRSDLIFLQRVLDTAQAELEAAVADGDVDESVLIDLDEAADTIKGLLR